MPAEKLIAYIVKHYDSRYLVPLSKRYDVETWNAAMREARRMGR
jgi:hypothetical protein